ncbi:MAG TPA: prolyl oligopeptidase family serine peptidase [Chitinispirillaceae bacterium]|nr:prolyl oligopeptidase family serine peptidase [Chitinispirillaceae bacterium]
MQRCCMFFAVISVGFTLNAQTINLRGTVSNATGKPIADAIVSLAHQGLKDTTGSDGAYKITDNTSVNMPLLQPQLQTIALNNGFLQFSLPVHSSVRIHIFDIKGTLIKKEVYSNASPGFYHFDVEKNIHSTKLLIIKATIGNNEFTFQYIPKYNATQTPTGHNIANSVNKLTKIETAGDTLKVSAADYISKNIAITSYNQELNITLDTANGAVGRSSGCGKTPTLKSGKQSVNVNGQTRDFMIKIPADYDNNHPYPLVFAFHWNGGNMNDVDGGGSSGYAWSYYGLREQADNSTNNKMIFVAPNGISAGWANSNGRDLAFVDEMLKLIKGDLCIDTTRIFAMGFSYGGGMSYAIACARANVFRAVAVYSGAVLSGCDGGNLPIAYIGIHGTGDPTCRIDGGRGLRDRFIKNNGCTSQPEPNVSRQSHTCITYENCNPKYPVQWCPFDGGHTPGIVDGGGDDGAKTWTKKEVWKFFTQF